MGEALAKLPDCIRRLKVSALDKERLAGLWYRTTPPRELDLVLESLTCGCSELAAALSGGFTKGEYQAMVDWGRGGHKAYARFWRAALMARGSKLAKLHKRVYDRGDLASDLVANKLLGGDDLDERGRAAVQNQVNVVIRRDFGEVVEGEAVEDE